MDLDVCFRKGEVGGDRGFDAAKLCFCCAKDGVLSEEGDKRKTRKPTANRPARIIVMGFVRRNDRDMDIVMDVPSGLAQRPISSVYGLTLVYLL